MYWQIIFISCAATKNLKKQHLQTKQENEFKFGKYISFVRQEYLYNLGLLNFGLLNKLL